MYIKIFAKDDTLIGQVDLRGTFIRGFSVRLMHPRGQFDRPLERDLQRFINVGLAHERTLEEAVEISLVDILKQIATDATHIGGGSPNFRVPEDLINQARDALAATEAP